MPEIQLGERFVPGNDKTHFCKPAGVVVISDGSIYVADGYCNSRIVRFSSSGQFMASFDSSASTMQSKLALSTDLHVVLLK